MKKYKRIISRKKKKNHIKIKCFVQDEISGDVIFDVFHHEIKKAVRKANHLLNANVVSYEMKIISQKND